MLALAASSCFSSAAAERSAIEPPRVIQTQSTTDDHVELVVTVTRNEEATRPDLDASRIMVEEDGVPQKVVAFTHIANHPRAFSLVIDRSNSLEGGFDDGIRMATECARRISAPDVAEAISFSNQVSLVQHFTSDAALLERAIAGIRKEGATSLHNALLISLEAPRRLAENDPRRSFRHIVVLFSDGVDTSSLVTFERVLDAASSPAMIYAIGPNGTGRHRGRSVLPRLSRETGGRSFEPARQVSPAQICNELMADASRQYLIRYVSSNPHRDGRWRRVEVGTNLPDARVRTRSGYFASGRKNDVRIRP